MALSKLWVVCGLPAVGALTVEVGNSAAGRKSFPWSRQTTFYLMDFITKGATDLLMAKDIEGGAVQYLADKLGVKQTGYRDWITGRLATDEIGHNAAVFVDSRVAFDQNDSPMRLTVTILPVDRNQLVFNVGPNVPALTDNDAP